LGTFEDKSGGLEDTLKTLEDTILGEGGIATWKKR
jgi:hypothetical protein